jgi:hypothetical protein
MANTWTKQLLNLFMGRWPSLSIEYNGYSYSSIRRVPPWTCRLSHPHYRVTENLATLSATCCRRWWLRIELRASSMYRPSSGHQWGMLEMTHASPPPARRHLDVAKSENRNFHRATIALVGLSKCKQKGWCRGLSGYPIVSTGDETRSRPLPCT